MPTKREASHLAVEARGHLGSARESPVLHSTLRSCPAKPARFKRNRGFFLATRDLDRDIQPCEVFRQLSANRFGMHRLQIDLQPVTRIAVGETILPAVAPGVPEHVAHRVGPLLLSDHCLAVQLTNARLL